jgi:hypothetical protein
MEGYEPPPFPHLEKLLFDGGNGFASPLVFAHFLHSIHAPRLCQVLMCPLFSMGANSDEATRRWEDCADMDSALSSSRVPRFIRLSIEYYILSSESLADNHYQDMRRAMEKQLPILHSLGKLEFR